MMTDALESGRPVCCKQNEVGRYLHSEVNEGYDLDGDGKNDVCFYKALSRYFRSQVSCSLAVTSPFRAKKVAIWFGEKLSNGNGMIRNIFVLYREMSGL